MILKNTYQLPNGAERLSKEQITKALQNFDYFTSNFQQITGKDRIAHPMHLNAFQRKIFDKLIPAVHPKTRLNRRHNIILLKCRQVGGSVGIVTWENYTNSFVEGMNNLNILHTFPGGDSVIKFYQQKVEPIITGTHPDLFATIDKQVVSKTSILTHYKDLRGKIPRNNYYELVSANASSIRGATCNVWIADECLSGNVEILTNKGFKRLDMLDKTELVAQYDCQTAEISFVKPQRYIDKEYDGDAYEWQIGDSKFVSTAFHDFCVKPTDGVVRRKTGEKFIKIPACRMSVNQNYEYPTYGFGCSEHQDLTNLERLGIAVQADGAVHGAEKRRGKRGESIGWAKCTIALKHPCKIRRLEKLLNSSGIIYQKTQQKRGYFTYGFDLPFENPKLLSSFLDVNCSYKRARQILHEVLYWDGSGLNCKTMGGEVHLPKHSYYSSAVKENRDFVASMALQAGQQVTVSVQKDTRKEIHRNIYRLHMNSRRRCTYDNFSRTEIKYKGRVYCVTVPTGAIVVRTGRDVWVCGNCSDYRDPYGLEDALSPALPDFGFSLVVYVSTFEDKKSDYFLEKIKIAKEEPDDWTLIFTPWFEMYPEQFTGVPLPAEGLNDYEQNVIMPALIESGLDKEKFGDYIDWYRRKTRTTTKMFNEYPTTLEEVLKHGEDDCVFSEEILDQVENTIEEGRYYSLSQDMMTGGVRAMAVDDSPIKIYREPIKGRKYAITVDPIASSDDKSDYFAASVFDRQNNEQVATILGRNRPIEDWAELTRALAILYNRAVICPESNIAQAFVLTIWSKGYYNWHYVSDKNKAGRKPGLQTTATSKPLMIERLTMLLKNKNIIIHDKDTLDQMRSFVVRKKRSGDARGSGKMEAKKGHNDDLCTCLWIYAGMLDSRQLVKHVKKSRFGWAVM